MRWRIDEKDRLVITVSKKEQVSLKAAIRRDEFESDAFMLDLLEPLVTNDAFTWLYSGCTGDLTSAPMLGVMGDEMPGPEDTEDALGMGLVHVGCWHHKGQPRQMYQPVLQRWAFMSYQITSPQRELGVTGKCVWEGGDLWVTQQAAESAVAEFENRKVAAK
jgi:hypothetical protein